MQYTNKTLKQKRFQHSDAAVDNFLQEMKEVSLQNQDYLLLLTGSWTKAKRTFAGKLSSVRGEEVTDIDLEQIITLDEDQSKENIDSLFDSLSDQDRILYISNGDRICGAYTGFTYSKVRYSTPQGKYLLEKMEGSGKIVLMDIQDEDNIDNTLARHSFARIDFPKPQAFFDRLKWKLSRMNAHGHNFPGNRPEIR